MLILWFLLLQLCCKSSCESDTLVVLCKRFIMKVCQMALKLWHTLKVRIISNWAQSVKEINLLRYQNFHLFKSSRCFYFFSRFAFFSRIIYLEIKFLPYFISLIFNLDMSLLILGVVIAVSLSKTYFWWSIAVARKLNANL